MRLRCCPIALCGHFHALCFDLRVTLFLLFMSYLIPRQALASLWTFCRSKGNETAAKNRGCNDNAFLFCPLLQPSVVWSRVITSHTSFPKEEDHLCLIATISFIDLSFDLKNVSSHRTTKVVTNSHHTSHPNTFYSHYPPLFKCRQVKREQKQSQSHSRTMKEGKEKDTKKEKTTKMGKKGSNWKSMKGMILRNPVESRKK